MSDGVRDGDPAAPMRVVHDLEHLRAADGPLFVAVGVFDGLHRGHAYLIDWLRTEATRYEARPAVITFDAHPDEILLGKAPPILCDADERLVRLERAGVSVTVVQHFDATLRMTPYTTFVDMVRSRAVLAGFLMTPDAAFGHERQGTPDALAALGREQAFEVVVVPAFEIGGRQVRSSDIRSLIAAGDLRGAGALLGRPVAIVGERSGAEEGSLASRAHDILTFDLPVAMPPPGRYDVHVSAAMRPGGPEAPTSTIASAIIPKDSSWVELIADRPLPGGARVRVEFPG